jgi:soluble lytic murein transglycosylase-like protein
MALTIAQIRDKYPLFHGESDSTIFEYLHKNQYSNIPRDDFAKAVGYEFPDKPLSSDVKEVGKGLGRGVLGNLNTMSGQAIRAFSPEGSAASEYGKTAEEYGKKYNLEHPADTEGLGPIAETAVMGAENIPTVLATIGAGVVGGPVGGLLATGGLYGGSTYQETKDRKLAEGYSENDAKDMALKNAAIDTVGEYAQNVLGAKVLGFGSKALTGTLDEVIAKATDASILKPWTKAATTAAIGDTFTEAAQDVGKELNERSYGPGNGQSLTDIALKSGQGALGVNMFLSPLGLHGHIKNARDAQAVDDLLKSTSPELQDQRAALATQLHAQAKANGAEDADAWLVGAKNDIANNRPIRRSATLDTQDIGDANTVDEAVATANAVVNQPPPKPVNTPAEQAGEDARNAVLGLVEKRKNYNPNDAATVADQAGEQARQQAIDYAKRAKSGAPDPIYDLITETARKYGVSENAMLETARIESKFNPKADNPNSTAGGIYQFLDSSAKNYNLADKYDAAQAADAAARMMKDNAATLFRALGRVPTDGELYLAHQQGGAGAARLLANPNAKAYTIVGREAVRLNGGDPNMTAGQFASLWTNKVAAEKAIENAAEPVITPDFNKTGMLSQGQTNAVDENTAGTDTNTVPVAGTEDEFNRTGAKAALDSATVVPGTQAQAPEQGVVTKTIGEAAQAIAEESAKPVEKQSYSNMFAAKKAINDQNLAQTHYVLQMGDGKAASFLIAPKGLKKADVQNYLQEIQQARTGTGTGFGTASAGSVPGRTGNVPTDTARGTPGIDAGGLPEQGQGDTGATGQPSPTEPTVSLAPSAEAQQLQSQAAKKVINNLNKPPKDTDELSVAIGKLGGIKYTGHAQRAGFSDYKPKQYRRLFNDGKNSKTLDEMAEALREHGYEVSGENDLVEKLSNSLGGKGVYTPKGYENQAALMAQEQFTEEQAQAFNTIDDAIERGIIDESEIEETPEAFDKLLAKAGTLSEEELNDLFGDNNADGRTKSGSDESTGEKAQEESQGLPDLLSPINAVGSNKPKRQDVPRETNDLFATPEEQKTLTFKQRLEQKRKEKEAKRQGNGQDGGELFQQPGIQGQQDLADVTKPTHSDSAGNLYTATENPDEFKAEDGSLWGQNGDIQPITKEATNEQGSTPKTAQAAAETGQEGKPAVEDSPKTDDKGFTVVRDVYGERHRVRKAELDGENTLFRTFDSDGKPLTRMHRENLLEDQNAPTPAYAGLNIIGTKETELNPNGLAFKTQGAAQTVLNKHHLQSTHDVIANPNGDGFVLKKKTDVPETNFGDKAPSIPESILANQTIEVNGEYQRAGDLLNNVRAEIRKLEAFVKCVGG